MDGARDYHTKWSKHTEKNIWYCLYVESKKKDMNRLTEKTNKKPKLMITKGEKSKG